MPKVSVIIPSFNRPNLLPRALASVVAQTFKDFDVVIINDGGCWPDASISTYYGSRVKTLHQLRGGPASARNKGLTATDSEFVAYLDDDDEWHPNHLETLLGVLELNSTLEMTYGIADVVDKNIHVRRWGDCQFDKFILDSFHTIFPMSTCMHRRKLLSNSGVFDENPLLIGPEDCEFTIRTSDLSHPAPSRRCTVTMHRDHSMTKESRKGWVDVLEYVIQKHEYGEHRRNWLMFYRAWVAALQEGRTDLAMKWSYELDRQLPSNLKRVEMKINGEIQLLPDGIKAFCRRALEV